MVPLLPTRFLFVLLATLGRAIAPAEAPAAFGHVLPTRTAAEEAVRVLDLLDNGDFADPGHELATGLPWWRTHAGQPRLEDGGCRLSTADVLEQPLAAFAPLADRLELHGEVLGRGRIELLGQDGTLRAQRDVEGAFRVGFEPGELGSPRYLLRVTAAADSVLWRRIGADVALPAPTPDALRAEARAELDRIHRFWYERALDDIGPRSTSFLTFDLDADTGAHGKQLARVSLHSYWSQLLSVYRLDGEASATEGDWRGQALVDFLDDLLAHGLNAETGLPQAFDPLADEPDVEHALEIHVALDFLLDMAEHGPSERRDEARRAALRIGQAVLDHGLRADGTVAAAYRPRDGQPAPVDPLLRQLDVPAQLARMSAWRGDDAFLRAAREALWTIEYKHVWPTAWGKIDPGFDDLYGHLGARALVMWRAEPEERAFREMVVSGLEVYLPALHDLVRFGGYVAADQVRCWRIFVDVAEEEPAWSERIAPTLLAAARQHFKGGQGDRGFWLDVTMDGWSPVSNLPVGDLLGLPQNLLQGLALLNRPESGLGPDERAEVLSMFTAVMRSSDTAYRGDQVHVMSPRRGEGFRSAEGSLRFAAGLVELLRALDGNEAG